MNLEKLQRMAMSVSGYMFKSGTSSGGTTGGSTGTSKNILHQQEYFDQLLGDASRWLKAGGLGAEDEKRRKLLDQAYGGYKDMAYGTRDPSILQGQLDAQSTAAADALEKQAAVIGQQSTLNRSAGSSRQGIATGIAAGEINKNLQQLQAQTIAQESALAEQRKQQGLQGLLGVQRGYTELGTEQERMADSYRMFKDLISGNMGGTTETDQYQYGSQKGKEFGFALSDKRSKKSMKKIGETPVKDDKVDVYEFEYKKGEGPSGKQVGVLAQDVEKVKPEATKEVSVGKKKKKKRKLVNYGALV